MSWKILNSLDLSGAPEAIEALEKVGTLISVPPVRESVLPQLGPIEAYLASASVQIDTEFLDAASNLRVIGSPSTGKDHMDVAEIERRGIKLFDISKEFDLINSFSATSELAFTLLLTLNRHIIPAVQDAKNGVWAREKYSGFQLLGKTFGTIGLGRLGKISARIANGFGMRVISFDPDPDQTAPNVEKVSFETLLKTSDVISIHIHLNEETDGLISYDEFGKMQQNVILLNTSRGRIIHEEALLSALQKGQIAGAGLDVIDGEWLDTADLYKHPLIDYSRSNNNLLIVPHIGGSTKESIYGARIFMAQKIANFLQS